MSRGGARLLRWAVRLALLLLAAVALAALAVALALPSRAVNTALDRRGLRAMAEVFSRGPRTAEGTLPFSTLEGLEALTRPAGPLTVERRPLDRHRRSGGDLVQEELLFASPVKVKHAASNQAHAYVYRRGPLGARPVVLWVPGLYMIDLAFIPIGWFITDILAQGADVVFYVPPYHLERTPPGFASGDALLATDLADHLSALAQELGDLRALCAWLRAQGANTVGAFGGSLGGTLLLRVVTWDDALDFLTVMMPPLRLADTILGASEAEPARARLRQEGHGEAEIRAIYGLLDPTAARPRLDPARISVLHGTYDLIAPEAAMRAWAAAWGVTRVRTYPRGHVLTLFNRAMYRDYRALLAEDLRAVASAGKGAPRPPSPP